MNSTPELSPDKPRAKLRTDSLESMITQGLGYCCPQVFWSYYHDTAAPILAARFGCTPETVRKHKQWFREGKFKCADKPTCLAERIKAK
jgi:hypothetical protein